MGLPESGEETVLRHPERIGIAIASAVLLAVMVKILVSFFRGQTISASVVLVTVVLWTIGFVAIASVLIWSTMVCTVVSKGPKKLTIYFKLGLLREVRSVRFSELTNVVAQQRFYGVKGRKIRRYAILFGPPRERSELLNRLTPAHVQALANGVLRDALRIE
jgi:hypothetical protein